jgi:hypothetical protein
MLVRSVSSPERYPYGDLTFESSEFSLDRLSNFLTFLKKKGVIDRPIAEVSEIRSLVGDKLPVKNVFDLSKLTTKEISRAFPNNKEKSDAAKRRRKLLEAAVKHLDLSSAAVDAAAVLDRRAKVLGGRIEPEVLRTLEISAGLHVSKRPNPLRASVISKAARYFRRVFFGDPPRL